MSIERPPFFEMGMRDHKGILLISVDRSFPGKITAAEHSVSNG